MNELTQNQTVLQQPDPHSNKLKVRTCLKYYLIYPHYLKEGWLLS